MKTSVLAGVPRCCAKVSGVIGDVRSRLADWPRLGLDGTEGSTLSWGCVKFVESPATEVRALRSEVVKQQRRAVLLVAYSWPPDVEVGAIRSTKLAKYLSVQGWEPFVISVKEKYYERTSANAARVDPRTCAIRTHQLPHPIRLYSVLKRKLVGSRNDVAPDAVASDGLGKMAAPHWFRTAKRMVLSLLCTPDRYQGWLPFAIPAALSVIRRNRVKYVVTTGPPNSAHFVGLAAKALTPVRWIADFRDPWSDNEQKPWASRSALATRVDRWLEGKIVRAADVIVCVSSAMTESYKQQYPDQPTDKWRTLTNGFDRDDFEGLGPVDPLKKFTVTYLGGFDYARKPDCLFQVLEELLRLGRIRREDVTVRLIGECKWSHGRPVEQMISQSGLVGVVEVIDRIPRRDALMEMRRSHVLLLLANEQMRQIPAKTYEYIGAGRPILAVTEKGSATAELLHDLGVGHVVAPDDLAEMAHFLLMHYERYKKGGTVGATRTRGEEKMSQELDWNTLGARYASLLASQKG